MAIDPATTPRLLRSVSSRGAERPPRGRGATTDPRRIELQRARKLITAVEHIVPLGLLRDPGRGLSRHRTVLVLRVLAAEPGLNNRQVALRAGVRGQAQISRILSRLARLALIENTRGPRTPGPGNAWQLTASGQELERAIGREAAAAASLAVDVSQEFGGRMDHRAVSVLRVLGDQPWLYTREVALRAGIKDPAQIARQLAHLAGLGLVASARPFTARAPRTHGGSPPQAFSSTGRSGARPRHHRAASLSI